MRNGGWGASLTGCDLQERNHATMTLTKRILCLHLLSGLRCREIRHHPLPSIAEAHDGGASRCRGVDPYRPIPLRKTAHHIAETHGVLGGGVPSFRDLAMPT